MVARMALILGWLALAVSLPMGMIYISLWNPPQGPCPTWALIYLFVDATDHLKGTLMLAPFFIGLVLGTLATLVPRPSPPLLWACRIGVVGVCESWAPGVLYWTFPQPFLISGLGIGFLFCAAGSLLIGLSAWIRPVRASSESENGKQSTASNANPNSGTGET